MLSSSPRPSADTSTRPLPTLGLLPVLAMAVAVSSPAFAQEAESDGGIVLDAVVVSAGRTAANSYNVREGSAATLTAQLLDTPRTVRVITQRQIEERGATSVEDVLRTTPGVTLGSGEGGTPYGTRPYIRGFEAAFSMVVDGVRTRGRTTYEAFNLETIEINMGSDGVTAGAGAGAGSINMTSKEPIEGDNFQHVSVMGGNASQKRVTADGNFAITDDITARLNLLWQDSGVPGSKHLEDKRYGVAPAISWRIGDSSKLTAKLQYVEETGVPGGRVPYANSTWNANARLPGWAYFGLGTPVHPYMPLENIDRNNFYGVLGRDFRESRNTSALLKFEHAFSNNFNMTSTLSYIDTEVQMAIMRPSVSVSNGQFVVGRNGNGGVRYSNRGTDTITFNTNFSGKFDLSGFEHSVSAGLEVARDRVRNGSTPTAVTTPNQTSLFFPNPYDPFRLTGSFGPLGDPATTDTKAVYIFDTVKLSEQWMVNGGLRVERFDIDDGTDSWGDTLLDYQVGLMFKPVPNATIYLSYNTTSSPPGACANQGGSNCPSESLNGFTTSTKAEKTTNLELGAKWDLFDGDLSLTAAVFNTEKDNQRVPDEDGNYVLNAGNSRGRGIDLGIAGNITDRWSLVGGYTYLDAKLVDAGPGSSLSGTRPINTAEHTFALWTTYKVTDKLMIGGGANYVSQKFVNPENTYAVPAYWRVDAMASYQINETAALQFNVNNLFDETYYDSSHVGSFATLQPGRSVTARLNITF